MIETFAMLALIWIALSAVLLLKNRKSPVGKPGKYIWVGEGKDPFKK